MHSPLISCDVFVGLDLLNSFSPSEALLET